MKKITITGSLGNIGSNLTKILVAQGHDVTVVTSNEDRKEAIEALGANAAVGSVSDVNFLSETFTGTDAVFAMTPPNLGGANIIQNTVNAGKAFAAAFVQAGVNRVVMLSSVGADYENGTGPILGLHHIENIYKELENVEVTFLRAGYFYTNFFNDIPLLKHAQIIGGNYSSEVNLPLVHPKDIAVAAAEELNSEVTGKKVRYIVSDVQQPKNYAKVLGNAVGLSDLPWVQFTDEQALEGMQQAGIPQEIAGLYTEMGQGINTHKLTDDFEKQGSPVTGAIKIADFAKEFAAKY